MKSHQVVCSGSPTNLSDSRDPYTFHLYREGISLGLSDTPEGIVGIAIAKSNDWVYAFYKSGYVSRGTSWNLVQHGEPYTYILPSGKSPTDIVGMASGTVRVASGKFDDCIYAWYRDGTFSIGRSWNLAELQDSHGHRYTLPSGYSPQDIIDLGISGYQGTNLVHAWYRNGHYSVGIPQNPGASLLQAYAPPPGASGYDDIVGMAISGSDEVYTWYVAEGAPTGDLAAASWCYEIDEPYGPGREVTITFRPIVENVGALGWSSTNKGSYSLAGSWPEEVKDYWYPLEPWPRWFIGPREKKVLPGLTLPFGERNTYYLRGWTLTHPDDVNSGNNSLTPALAGAALGREFLPGGSLAHMKRTDPRLMSPYS